MILDDSPAFPAAFLGAMRIGAVPVPVNPMDRVDNYAYYLDDSYARVLVRGGLAAGRARGDARRAAGAARRRGGRRRRAATRASPRSTPADAAALPPPLDTHREDMAFWLYSSGSTGRPKGVVHTHGDIGVTVDRYARNVLRISADDVCYSTTKLFHAYGLGNSLSFPLSVGACSTLVEGPRRPRSASSRRSLVSVPTLFFSVPALYAAMVRAPGGGRGRLLFRARVRVGRRGAARRGAGALAGRRPACRSWTGSARPRCSTSTARTRLDDLAPGTSGRPGSRLRPAAGRRARPRGRAR